MAIITSFELFWIILFSEIHLTEVSVSAIMALDLSYIEKRVKEVLWPIYRNVSFEVILVIIRAA